MPTIDPRDPRFWSDELRDLLRRLTPVTLRILMNGAEAGAALLPPGSDLLINWDTFNQHALDWLNDYGRHWLDGINQTSQRQVIRIFEEWVKAGDPLDILKEKLTPIYGPARAARIATTEVTRIYAEGNIRAWRETGIVGGKRWMTARDDKVCPICAPLDQKIVSLDGAWTQNERGEIVEAAGGMGLMAPPAHANCRCWLQPIVSEQSFEQVLRRQLGLK